MILYNSANSIRDLKTFCGLSFFHNSVVKYTSSLLQKRTGDETWLPNITEIAPLKLAAGWICPVADNARDAIRLELMP